MPPVQRQQVVMKLFFSCPHCHCRFRCHSQNSCWSALEETTSLSGPVELVILLIFPNTRLNPLQHPTSMDFQRRIEQLNGSRRRNRFASDDVSRTKQAREEETRDKIKASSHLSPWTNDAKRAINSNRLAVISSQ